MRYSQFTQLLSGREKETVDFKIQCDAFASKAIGPKAELVKDICAMANNGNVASYILIGVADDGRRFESVANPKLTDDNLQSFCKTAIHPPPKIKVHRECWSNASAAHRGKEFVIIQVGPHVRQAYRLARDFIAYEERVCHRRNEVWVRREATSDLATPEEITRLTKGQAPQRTGKPEDSVEYLKLATAKQTEAIWEDLRECAGEMGGVVHRSRVAFRVGRVWYVWRWVIETEWTTKLSAWYSLQRSWRYEHGALLLAMRAVAKRAFPADLPVHFEEKWGHFSIIDMKPRDIWRAPSWAVPLPVNMTEASITAMTLSHIADTDALRTSLTGLLEFLGTETELTTQIRQARDTMNHNLRRWLNQGWLLGTNRWFVGTGPRRDELADDEVFDSRLSGQVLKRVRRQKLIDEAWGVLALSSGRYAAQLRSAGQD